MSGHTAYRGHEIKGYLVSIGKRTGITTLPTSHVKARNASVVVALIWHEGNHIADIRRVGLPGRNAYFTIEATPDGMPLEIDDLANEMSKSITLASAKVLRHLDTWDVVTKRERQTVLRNIAAYVEENQDRMDEQMVSIPYMSNEFYSLVFSTDVADIIERGEIDKNRKALWKMTRNELVTYLLIVLEAYAE